MNFNIDYNQHSYRITAMPLHLNGKNGHISGFRITLDGYSMGCLTHSENGWKSDNIIDQNLIDIIGSCIKEQFVLNE